MVCQEAGRECARWSEGTAKERARDLGPDAGPGGWSRKCRAAPYKACLLVHCRKVRRGPGL